MATVHLRRFLNLVRWRTDQTQIEPSGVGPPEVVQFYDLEKLGRWEHLGDSFTLYAGPDLTGGGRLLALGGVIASVTAEYSEPREHAITIPLRRKLCSDFSSGAQPPLWRDYVLSARGTPRIERQVVDAGIAAELFIDRYVDGISPGYTPPRATGQPTKSTIELMYRNALIALKFPDIAVALSKDYENVRYLFRARNSVAHEGVAKYLDDAGRQHTVDKQKVGEFLSSLEACIAWVEALP